MVTPADHPVSDLDLDVIVGANGKSRSLPGAYVTAVKVAFHSTKPQPLSVSNSVFFNTNRVVYHTTLVYSHVLLLLTTDFRRTMMRGKFAIAVTANFKNRRTTEEVRVRETGALNYLNHRAFFHRIRDEIGVDLENIVYFKDETHYFVMTVRKETLLKRGVLKQVLVPRPIFCFIIAHHYVAVALYMIMKHFISAVIFN